MNPFGVFCFSKNVLFLEHNKTRLESIDPNQAEIKKRRPDYRQRKDSKANKYLNK